jgi:hypothetical protein
MTEIHFRRHVSYDCNSPHCLLGKMLLSPLLNEKTATSGHRCVSWAPQLGSSQALACHCTKEKKLVANIECAQRPRLYDQKCG